MSHMGPIFLARAAHARLGSACGPRAESGGPPDSVSREGFGEPPKPTRQRRVIPGGGAVSCSVGWSWLASVLLLLAGLASAHAQETRRLFLSGHGKDDAVPWKFMCTSGAQSGYWTNLAVPSNWEMFGFGSLNYHKDPTNAWNEKGLYEHDFQIPSNWSGKRVFLVFEGVMTDTRASLNGQSVGPVHQGGFYQFQYEVTRLVKFGSTNRLEVTVAKHSANNSVNHAERMADYWVFGGIYRPVYIEAVPRQFIRRVAIDARAHGAFAMDVFVNGTGDANRLEAQVMTLAGRPVGRAFSTRLAGEENVLKTQIDSPREWTAETPNLYQVEVRLKAGRRVLHVVHQRFGFRTIEVRKGDGIYVNGRRVVLKGASRHSIWPDSGRCLSEAVHRLDIKTMKDMNMNAVRMSHYPPDAQFLDLCDQRGLYVLDELAGWHAYYDTDIGRKLVREMVTRDVNHPCILFWDNGNEGGFNTNLDAVFGQYDPQGRDVLHPWTPFGGVNTAHYQLYDQVKVSCTGVPIHWHYHGGTFADPSDTGKWIYMPTEFLHGLYDGGAGAGLEDYWNVMGKSPLCAGGFIWALLDAGVRRPHTGEMDVAGNRAPDGIVGPYRQREASFYTIKQIWSPIEIRERTLPPDFSGTLTVENHYSFTDARQCSFVWQLRKFRRPDEPAAGFRVIAQGTAASPEIAPGKTGLLRLRVPASRARADALALRVSDPTGRELWTWVWPLPELAKALSAIEPHPTRGAATKMVEFGDSLEVEAGSMTVTFNRRSGLLSGVKRGAQTFSLANGPRPADGTPAKLVRLEHTAEGSDAVVTATFEGDLKSVRWRVHPDGWVQCDYAYTARGPQEYFGVAFDYPERLVKAKKWLGDGPYRVWKNRLMGQTLNVWQNDYNNTITGYRDWVYPEFKGCFAGVRWMQYETAEGPITIVPGSPRTFVQVLTPAFPPDKLVGQTLVHLPRAGLALLDAIPPIGTKFKPASTMGPQGQLAVGHGEYRGTVKFYFGKLPR